MARRKTKKRAENNEFATAGYQCKDCANSYDWHSKALDGSMILCRCPYKQDGGKWCIFLSQTACEKFILRNGQNNQ